MNGEHGTFILDKLRQRVAQRLLFRLVDANCTVSASLQREMHDLFGIPMERVTPFTNGVDTERFQPNEIARKNVRENLGIRPDDIVFGTVGRFVPVKDYPMLIAAFNRLADEFREVRLLMIGDGPERARLESLAGQRLTDNRIIFVGNRDDVPTLMPALDVFCLTSVHEGLSNTLLEAQACGLPAIATKTGGNGEAIEDGHTGHLFDVGARSTLVAIMRRLVSNTNERVAMGNAARRRAVNDFSIAGMVRAYERQYQSLLQI